MTLVILALDALDAQLVDDFGCDGFHLGTSTGLQTDANMHPVPFTLEVWPSVATGLRPEGHGVTSSGTSEWDNPVIHHASKFTGHLPEQQRNKLGDLANKLTGAEWTFGTTDAPTIFDGPSRVVHNWPGVANPEELRTVWEIMEDTEQGDISVEGFEQNIYGIGAEQFGWAREMATHNLEVAGVHIHTPDAFGHPCAVEEQRENLKEAYEWVERHVQEVVASLGEEDELLILSDHGMQVEWLGDENLGKHSFRAFASSTLDSVPQSIYDVYNWVEENMVRVEADDSEMEMPTEILRDLGYVE